MLSHLKTQILNIGVKKNSIFGNNRDPCSCTNQNQEIPKTGQCKVDVCESVASEEAESEGHPNTNTNETYKSDSIEEGIMKGIMDEIKDSATPHHFASSGFFYSHPRMTGLEVLKANLKDQCNDLQIKFLPR